MARALAEELFRAYLQQILVDGFFHADPHPGNVFLTDDYRVALIDLGMVGGSCRDCRNSCFNCCSRSRKVAGKTRRKSRSRSATERGLRRKGIQARASLRSSRKQQGATVEQMQVGRLVLEVTQASAENGIRVPPELTMLGKTLLNLDQVGRAHRAGFRSECVDSPQRCPDHAAAVDEEFVAGKSCSAACWS